MKRRYFTRQLAALVAVALMALALWTAHVTQPSSGSLSAELQRQYFGDSTAQVELAKLLIKGRAPKTGYARKQFGDGWGKIGDCSVREVILARDLTDVVRGEDCKVQRGTLHDPYTGQTITFQRGPDSSAQVQIDHVVALSDAWQKGAQQLSPEERRRFANDPLNLLAVDGPANQAKGDADAASWLPPNKAFRCQYAARQVAVKRRYQLWVTAAEAEALQKVLQYCQ